MEKNKSKTDRFRVLIVDDELDVIVMLADLLGKVERYEVLRALSGKDALLLLEKEEIDIILLDICMPEMDGIEILDEIMKKNSRIAVVMVTIMDNVDVAIEAVKKGAWNYVVKPIRDEKRFLEILEKAELKRTVERIDEELSRLAG